MPDYAKDIADDGTDSERREVVERVSEELVEDVLHGRVVGDTASVLAGRLRERGIELRPEAIDNLAEDIEDEASR